MALINLRNALMAGKRLPYDAEVEYLKGTGTQWIDTGVAAFAWPYLEITCKVNASYNQNGLRGIIGNSNGLSRWQGIAPSGTNEVTFRGFDDSTTIPESVTSDFITLIFDGPNRTAYAGQSNATLLSGKAAGTTYGVWAYVGRVAPIAMSVASVKIGTSRDNLLFDGIPVRKGTVGYLYDRVSGKLFGNAGTGDFVVGPDVVPVEYIESHGTEWIDTGYRPNSITEFSIVYKPAYYGTTFRCVYGVQDGNAKQRFYFVLSGSDTYKVQISSIANSSSYCGFNTNGTITDATNGNFSPDNRLVSVVVNNPQKRVVLNGVEYAMPNWWGVDLSCPHPLALLGRRSGGAIQTANLFIGKIERCHISENGVLVRDFIPVRVGTEGAMMDTLTRRIYRNDGTGAFTYGNDLKYPIPAE